MQYENFDLEITPHGGGHRARVLQSPCGEARHDFTLPFATGDVADFHRQVGHVRGPARGAAPLPAEALKSFGGRLFDAVFDGAVRERLVASLEAVRGRGNGLRIRLRLAGAGPLAELPWEYLYRADRDLFLSLSAETPVVRYLDLPDPAPPLRIAPPLRVLVMISKPSNAVPLDVEREWGLLRDALAGLEAEGRVAVHRLPRATLPELVRALAAEEYHVFHFVGHGGFDADAGDGVLEVEDEAGLGRTATASEVATLLRDERLRLAVLNACEGARVASDDPFAGVASRLVRHGIPAVVAMQYAVTDEAAIAFTRAFYEGLAAGRPVDAALAETRKMLFAGGNAVEWGTPVLHLRAPDGRLFEIEDPTPAVDVPPPPVGTVPEVTPEVPAVLTTPGKGKRFLQFDLRSAQGRGCAGTLVLGLLLAIVVPASLRQSIRWQGEPDPVPAIDVHEEMDTSFAIAGPSSFGVLTVGATEAGTLAAADDAGGVPSAVPAAPAAQYLLAAADTGTFVISAVGDGFPAEVALGDGASGEVLSAVPARAPGDTARIVVRLTEPGGLWQVQVTSRTASGGDFRIRMEPSPPAAAPPAAP